MQKQLGYFLLCIIFATNFYAQEAIPEEQKIKNIEAFAKLYGYIRYFHPSDEASRIPWERFVTYGCSVLKNATTEQELKTRLKELFTPIAPTLELYFSAELPSSFNLVPPIENKKLVAWQHKGIGFGSTESFYSSIRTNRPNALSKGYGFGNILQSQEAVSVQGKEFRFLAYVKTNVQGEGNQGQLWFRVDRPNQQIGFFDNMAERPIVSSEWKPYEIQGKIDQDALEITFGCFLNGSGQLWIDQVQLFFKNATGAWEPAPLENAGFESAPINSYPPVWSATGKGHLHKVTTDDAYEGKQSLFIESQQKVFTGKLFSELPSSSAQIQKELIPGLFCRFPLVLSSEASTIETNASYRELLQKIRQYEPLVYTEQDENARIGNICIAWNIFQHFYPYFDVVSVDWKQTLRDSLRESFKDQNEKDSYRTLSRLVAKLQDGHGNVFHPFLRYESRPAFRSDWIEEQVVITASKDTGFQVGDILLSIDGVSTKKLLAQSEALISGSPQWKRYVASNRLGQGEHNTLCKIQIKRGEDILEKEALRHFKGELKEYSKAPIFEVEPKIYYVHLGEATWFEIRNKIEALATAKGVIFDLRGYPNNNHYILSHLLKTPDTSKEWMQIPLFLYPDQENLSGYLKSGWQLPSLQPSIQGKVVFITDARAISYAESVLSFVEHYRLGEILGQPTAGANGNVNPFMLPGYFSISWTGMKVLKHDGSPHHLIGVQPTIPVKRTLQGVLEGRDEYYEKAILWIKQ